MRPVSTRSSASVSTPSRAGARSRSPKRSRASTPPPGCTPTTRAPSTPGRAPRSRSCSRHPRVVAVGECGLDFFRMRSPRPEQERALAAQLTLSKAYDLPLVIHVRDAWPEILRVLDEGSAERVVLHCFSGDAEIARGCADRGWFLSFAGNVTYPKNAHLREAAAAVPLGAAPRRDRQPVPRASASPRPRQHAVERRGGDRRDRDRSGRTCGNREGNHGRERPDGLPQAPGGPLERPRFEVCSEG